MLPTYTIQEDASTLRMFWSWGNKGKQTPKLCLRKPLGKSKSIIIIFWVKCHCCVKMNNDLLLKLAASFFIECSSGYCKMLIQLQSSVEVYSAKFFQPNCCIHRGIEIWSSVLRWFGAIASKVFSILQIQLD